MLPVSEPAEARNIVLTGMMGSGKTLVGRLLATRLGRPFVDLDALIEERAGIRIAEIFRQRGEDGFRRLEATAVRSLAGKRGAVIATGGGTILNPENLRVLQCDGEVVCLTATPECLLKRISKGDKRPLLDAPDRLARIRSLFTEREPAYRLADHWIDTTDLTVEEVAERLVKLIERNERKNVSLPKGR